MKQVSAEFEPGSTMLRCVNRLFSISQPREPGPYLESNGADTC